MPVSAGRILLERAVPEDMRGKLPAVVDKKTIAPFLQELAEKHPEAYQDVLHRLVDIGGRAATERGREMSVGLRDIMPPPTVSAAQIALREQVHTISQDPKLTAAEKSASIIKLVQSQADTLRKLAVDDGAAAGGSLATAAKHGFRGDAHQLSQILIGDLLVADPKGRIIPVPGLHGYGEGTTPDEYWAGAYGARTGFASVQLATAKAGYLGKQVALAVHRQVVTGDDCGAQGVGLEVRGDNHNNVGYVLSKDVEDFKAGTVITRDMLPKLAGKDVLVRSVATCQMPEGVCKLCSGKREQGRFPAVGDYIGIQSGRVLSEPLTQMTLKMKHLGGAAGVSDTDAAGFDAFNRLFQVPERYVGAAVLATADSKVGKIYAAPQGGQYVELGQDTLYVPPERKLTVKPGDALEAGDALSDGIPNPAEIGKYKGIGEGRQYMIKQVGKMLDENGIPSHRRNVEVVARAMFDRVSITDPDGVAGFFPGDAISYSDLQKSYIPRQGSVIKSSQQAVGKYLEKPVLHYSIGTRITPRTAEFLTKHGATDILVHDDPPGFEPEISRLTDIPATESDWKARLAGWRVKQTLVSTAQTGGVADESDTSYIPKVMNPVKL